MIFFKIVYHLKAMIWMSIFKLVYKFANGRISFGKQITFRKGFSIMIAKKGVVSIGNNVFFNNYCSLNANDKISIGDGTLFGENVKVYDHNHCYKNTMIPLKKQGFTTAPVSIGKHCWIGSNVIILKGVTIGDNSVIGAGCIIYKDVPPNTIVYNKQELIMRNLDSQL